MSFANHYLSMEKIQAHPQIAQVIQFMALTVTYQVVGISSFQNWDLLPKTFTWGKEAKNVQNSNFYYFSPGISSPDLVPRYQKRFGYVYYAKYLVWLCAEDPNNIVCKAPPSKLPPSIPSPPIQEQETVKNAVPAGKATSDIQQAPAYPAEFKEETWAKTDYNNLAQRLSVLTGEVASMQGKLNYQDGCLSETDRGQRVQTTKLSYHVS